MEVRNSHLALLSSAAELRDDVPAREGASGHVHPAVRLTARWTSSTQ